MSAYEELVRGFRWRLPPSYNLAADVLGRHPPGDTAIVVSRDGRTVERAVTFGELGRDARRLANALRARGVGPGDRVALLLSQRPETAACHLATALLGAVAVPLSTAFGPEALDVRLRDAEPGLVVAEGEAAERARSLGLGLEVIDADRDLPGLLAQASARLEPAPTTPDTPALLVYTSGTTGPPKGALHGHRVLPGHLPGFELSHDGFPQPGDLIWTPADWAWIGGLYDVLVPGLRHGRPVLAFRQQRLDPERALDAMARLGVRNAFMPATALRLLRGADGPRPSLRTLASGGETVGEETAAWCEERLGLRLNEFYGQTEANLVVGNSAAWPATPGSMGRAYPGHEVRLLDGEVCVRVEGDPVVFLGYWRRPEATAEKVRDGWLRTGDLATVDGDGCFRFVGRADDLISSGGYRIGPGEIEDCLVRHPAVALAAAIGVPDPVRGERVKAFVVPAAGVEGTDALAEELRALVRERLAPYEVPRELEFVPELPLTVTGKVRRGELRRREAERRG